MAHLTAPPPETLPEFMRRMRERRRLTQEQAAARLKVSPRQYLTYEKTGEVPPERFAAVATLFGVTEGVVAMLASGTSEYRATAAVTRGFWEIVAIVDRVRSGVDDADAANEGDGPEGSGARKPRGGRGR